MTNEDAIKWLENLKHDIGQLRHEDLWPYAQAIDGIIATMEEQEPKPIRYKENWMTGLPVAHCPKCGKALFQLLPADEDETKFCPWCGQSLKWIN